MLMNSLRPILLVEDDSVDIMTVKRCFKKLKIPNKLIVAQNGEMALELLAENIANPHPCIVLLDINMPKMNGLEFLQHIKNSPDFKQIPIIMLTSSKEETDISRCFELGIAGYLLKPVEYDQFVKSIEVLNNYWSVSELPK